MKPLFKLARYRSKARAQRYANELAAMHPGTVFTVVQHPFDPFNAYAVQTIQANGRPAYSARRPVNFGKFIERKAEADADAEWDAHWARMDRNRRK